MGSSHTLPKGCPIAISPSSHGHHGPEHSCYVLLTHATLHACRCACNQRRQREREACVDTRLLLPWRVGTGRPYSSVDISLGAGDGRDHRRAAEPTCGNHQTASSSPLREIGTSVSITRRQMTAIAANQISERTIIILTREPLIADHVDARHTRSLA